MGSIGTALLSVYDKAGIREFASELSDRGVKLISTGGTARALREAGLEVTGIEEITGHAEMLGGRVKTLQPQIFGGILARREDPGQMQELVDAGITGIDLVVVNLYPFEETIADADCTLQRALEQIDIGGVSLLRAAYKNFASVAVVVDPADYEGVIAAMDGGELSLRSRLSWARKAVAHTAAYEAAIGNYLTSIDGESVALDAVPARDYWPQTLTMSYQLSQSLRYGENPHQPAASYLPAGGAKVGVAAGRQLQGKELSFNNLLDADAAWQLAWALPQPGAAVIKHANPCGAAVGETIAEAYVRARSTDPVSAFGGIVAANVPIDGDTAAEIATTFIEVVIAPGFTDAALDLLASKENLRLIVADGPGERFIEVPDYRWVSGGLLAQGRDLGASERWEVVSERQPTEAQSRDLHFLWKVIPSVKSNAIIVGGQGQLYGVGAGQMSRVDSCRIAVWKATDAGHDLVGSAAASDAFFPFPDGLEALAEAGVEAIVQPGGSRRDEEVVAAADRLGIVLVHTGARHFRH